MAEHFDLAIVGGGPAGQAAAIALQGLDLSIAVIDEQAQPGGQILRQPPAQFAVRLWLPGRAYDRLKAQTEHFGRLDRVSWLGRHTVIEIARDGAHFALLTENALGVRAITADRVLIAAGCQDLAVPLAGWTLPGVYTAGAIQAFVKSQQYVPGERIVLAGTHPLQLLIAAQIVAAGGTVAEVLFAQPISAMFRAVLTKPLVGLRGSGNMLAAAAALRILRRAGVPVSFGSALQRIEGESRVTHVILASGRRIACDTVGLNYGFVPQSLLPRMMGAKVRPAGAAGGFAAVHDEWMRSSLPGLYVAGETTGVAGAPASQAEGELAGVGIGLDAGWIDMAEAGRQTRRARSRHRHLQAFARLLDTVANPLPWFPVPEDDTIICRCEDVDYATLAAQSGGGSANAVKLITRCGMGPCQGRNCEPSLLRMLDDRGLTSDPGFTQRFPARPIPVSELADPG
ncbi:NAD(P)/FAD-dependent oxidoreductase [Sphingobium boeckii]|uniref:Thioredoxin reductase n=1 Tax=Sphingobium boeckii TaxID=1082345 RepID=A0A7W9AJS4_9SPHN|nr:NAD(P)/FAD-dependent oxidoreductase [Sphingobium boeckii]MBB5686863.1 thioredoxin reductase [Sphingobium boeckii]